MIMLPLPIFPGTIFSAKYLKTIVAEDNSKDFPNSSTRVLAAFTIVLVNSAREHFSLLCEYILAIQDYQRQ